MRDHDLIKRSHTQGILNPDKRANDEWEASIYVFEGKPGGDRNCATGTSMNMVLRPGEAITWRWGHADPVKYHGDNKPRYPDTICNGLWEYRPDFSRDLWKKGAASIEGVQAKRRRTDRRGGKDGSGRLDHSQPVRPRGRPARSGGQRGEVLAVVGREVLAGRRAGPGQVLPARRAGALRIPAALRAGRRRSAQAPGHRERPPDGAAGAAGDVGRRQQVRLHGPVAGRTAGADHARLGRALRLPAARSSCQRPSSRRTEARAEGTDLVFRWPARQRSGRRPDRRLPLRTLGSAGHEVAAVARTSTSSSRRRPTAASLSTRCRMAGSWRWTEKYYWRVRARNEKGVWGPWSPTWSFTPRGPASPTDVTLAVDRDPGTGVLRWRPNPAGRKPAKYRIYGSDEKGFSISDEPYQAVVGVSKVVSPNRPANFMAEVSATDVAVIGARDRPSQREPSLLPRRRGGREGEPERSFRFRGGAAADALFASGDCRQGGIGLPLFRSPPFARSATCETRVVGGKETMNYWDIDNPALRPASTAPPGSRSTRAPECSRAFRTVPARWSSS